MHENIGKLFNLIREKYDFNKANSDVICNGESRKNWNTSEMYIRKTKEELSELEEEIKPNNTILIEDELGDILGDFLNLSYSLKQEGFIESEENIFIRCEKKFEERIRGIKSGITWETVKEKQKAELNKENNTKYFDN